MNTYTLILDKERSLKYTNRSFRELEKRSGIPVLTKIGELSKGEIFSFEYITQFIWAGLIHESVPYETVIDIIPLKRYVELITFITNVVSQEYGLNTKEEKKSQLAEEVSQTIGTGIEQNSLPIQT